MATGDVPFQAVYPVAYIVIKMYKDRTHHWSDGQTTTETVYVGGGDYRGQPTATGPPTYSLNCTERWSGDTYPMLYTLNANGSVTGRAPWEYDGTGRTPWN
jgi:hypothetical protein